MNKTVITTIAALSITAGAFAQGSINFSDVTTTPYVEGYTGSPSDTSPTAASPAANYSGAFDAQIWYENSTTDQASITTINALNGNIGAGTAILAFLQGNSNFHLEGSVNLVANGANFTDPSVIALPDAPTGGNGILVIYANNGGSLAGGVAFVNPTGGNAGVIPPGIPANLTGWNTINENLVMSPTPEPSTIALGGLGAASLLLFRRRK